MSTWPFQPPRGDENLELVTPEPGDRTHYSRYRYTPEIELAVNVALVTKRPLLVGGPPGSGKSSLAESVARTLNWRYLVHVVSSRTQARDLLWTFDAVRRLQDAQAQDLLPNHVYVEPGILWKAFHPSSAADQSTRAHRQPVPAEPADQRPAVVLLDEIDKADPDVPNDLLVPLGSFQFEVAPLGHDVMAEPDTVPLIIMTTNDERQLSKPFVRRCVVLNLKQPGRDALVSIAEAHFGPDDDNLYFALADVVTGLAEQAMTGGVPAPSAAEYLDALDACRKLDITPDPGSDQWQLLSRATLQKRIDPSGTPDAPP